MQAVAQYIFLFLVMTTILNLIIAIVARIKTGHREFNFLIGYWVAVFFTYTAVAILSQDEKQIAFAFFFQVVSCFLMAKILRDSRGIRTNWGTFGTIWAVCALISTVLILMTDVGFTVSVLPVVTGTALPFIEPAWNALVAQRKESNWVEKALGLLFVTGVIHSYNYAFFRMDESAAWWGWAISVAQYQCLSIFLPLLINYRREEKERKNLEEALERVSGKGSFSSSAAIDELYLSLQGQIHNKENYSRELARMNRHLEEEREINEILIKTISHDLANPLTVVNAYMDMIGTGKISTDDQWKIQDRMRMNLKAALDMIQRVRKTVVTRSEANLLKLGPVDLKLALERLKYLFEDRLAQKNLSLRMSTIDGNLTVLADENALVENVLANLLSNAVKFSYENSDILIDVRTNNEMVFIDIRDFGVGLNPSRMAKTKFISTPGTKGEEGSGFGLMVTGYFIRKFGAKLEIKSHSAEGGRGTSFIVGLKRTNEARIPDRLQSASTVS